jgi:chemotaxis signal transduction protein
MSLVEDLLPHMRRVLAADRDLHDLSLLWQMIEASSAISCPDEAETILPTLRQTRERFADLQQRLVHQLAQEHLAALGDELASIAQCTVDILVRNLFERTADVGFLATDEVLRTTCALPPAERRLQAQALRRRLTEYRDKYTVYDDIIVLSPEGAVLARLDGGPDGMATADAIVAKAVASAGHVEQYGPTDLSTGRPAALLYGHRIDDAQGRCIGVLVLRFRCVDEMQRIFRSVGDGRPQVAIALIDDQDRVLFSNDDAHVPPAARLHTAAADKVAVTIFGGREYLSVTCTARSYQGYAGPGWRAQAMVSLLTAFRGSQDDRQRQHRVALDNEALRRIQLDVDAINRNLRRVVWNGRLVAGQRGGRQAQLKAVLGQVNSAGARTRDRVAAAIDDLYLTALGRAGHQAQELARLAADIMDRNLYERANDCRWWALSPVLQRVLAAPADASGAAELQAVLAHVNGLYTVYTRLVAFDAQGCIRAASNDTAAGPLTGQAIDPGLLRATQALSDSQRYAVSEFAASPLSDEVPTYVYLAAVRAPDTGRVVGGIAIVFDAEREFRAMLNDVLGDRQGLAAFVDRAGLVLASTDPALALGRPLPFDLGQDIVECDGSHLAVSSMHAAGYREFKHTDGYRNDVRAVVALRLGALDQRHQGQQDVLPQAHPCADRTRTRELALFRVAGSAFAVPLPAVLEAREPLGLVRAPGGRGAFAGLLEVQGDSGPVVIPVLCARQLLGEDVPVRPGEGVVLVHPAEPGRRQPAFGMRVDEVITVAEVGDEHVQPVPANLRGSAELVCGLVRMARGDQGTGHALVQLMDFNAVLRAAGLASNALADTLALAA